MNVVDQDLRLCNEVCECSSYRSQIVLWSHRYVLEQFCRYSLACTTTIHIKSATLSLLLICTRWHLPLCSVLCLCVYTCTVLSLIQCLCVLRSVCRIFYFTWSVLMWMIVNIRQSISDTGNPQGLVMCIVLKGSACDVNQEQTYTLIADFNLQACSVIVLNLRCDLSMEKFMIWKPINC